MIANPLPGDPDVATAPELIWTAPGEAMELFATASHRTVRVVGGVAHRRSGSHLVPWLICSGTARATDSAALAAAAGARGCSVDGRRHAPTMRSAIAAVSMTNRLRPRPRNTCVLRQPRARRVLDQRHQTDRRDLGFDARLGAVSVESDGASQDDDLLDARLSPQRLDRRVDARGVGEVHRRRRARQLEPVEELGDQPARPPSSSLAGASEIADGRQVLAR